MWNQLKVEGFIVTRWAGPKWNEAAVVLASMIASGKLVAKQTVVDGFENVPKAFAGLFTGDNMGKMIVKC